ncbi:MAG: response regulator transcription factor, partial [Anaerolineales bacterium]|nr:response regulator transcription factor [Anaerolineales bacterium]
MSEPIRVLVADDHPLFLDGVVHSLTGEPNIEVIGRASSGGEALQMAREHLPDVLLLDIAMPGRGGIVAAGEVAAACPTTKIIMLTVSKDEDDLMAALKA